MTSFRSALSTPPAVSTPVAIWVAVLLLVCNAVTWLALDRAGMVLYLENGAMENLQLGGLILGAVLAFAASFRCSRATRIGLLGISLLLVNMAMREFEPEESGLTGFALWILDSTGRNLITSLLWAIWVVFVVLNLRDVWLAALSFDRLIFGLLFAGGLFYAIGSLVDHTLQFLPPERQMFCQEFIETHGAILIGWASVVLCLEVRKQARRGPDKEPVA